VNPVERLRPVLVEDFLLVRGNVVVLLLFLWSDRCSEFCSSIFREGVVWSRVAATLESRAMG